MYILLLYCSCVLLWDTKPPKGHQVEEHDKSLTGVPNTFKHLDLTWKPLLKVMNS